jgi:transposase-like protein
MDAASQLIVIGVAVVESESSDSWQWFLRFLIQHHPVLTQPGYSVISDRQKGLIQAVSALLLNAHHRYCSVHLRRNLKAKFGEGVSTMFDSLVYACQESEWTSALDKIKAECPPAALYLDRNGSTPPEEYSNAFFQGCTFGHTSSNIGTSL